MSLRSPPALTLFRGFPVRNNYVWSPFVNKLEARLRFEGVKYKLDVGNPRVAPRGKIPYVSIEGSPELLGDSTLITQYFIQQNYLSDLNAHLTPTQKAHDLAIRALLEDKLYFYQVRERWDDNYYTMRDTVLAAIPYPVRIVVGILASRGALSTLYGQGTQRYTKDELAALRLEIWQSVNDLLAEARSGAVDSKKPFWVLGGQKPTEADPVLFAFITSSLVCQAAPDTEKVVRGFPVILEYAQRIHNLYFSDFEGWKA